MSKKDLDIILKYWKYDHEKGTYLYKTSELTNSSNLIKSSDVRKLVKINSSIALNNKQSICPECKTRFKSKNRSGVKELPTSPELCNSCKKELENEYISAKMDYLEDKLKLIHPVDNFYDDSLSYIELISLYLLIKPGSSRRPIFYKKDKLGLTLSSEVDGGIINSLSKRKLIFDFSEKKYKQLTLNDYPFRENSFPLFSHDGNFISGFDHADQDLVKQLLILFRTSLPKQGLHIPLPQNYKNFSSYKKDVDSKIKNYKINLEDIKQIESLVLKQRLGIAFNIVNSVSNYFKLKIEPSLKLEAVLISLVKKYTIEEVNSIIFTNASSSKHYIEFINSDFNKYAKKFLFTKNLERTLDFFEGKDLQMFKIELPNFLKGSKLENFFNTYIAKKSSNDEGAWQSLSVNEIVALWIKSF
ncbi:MAG: hypothetical protein IBX55_19870 [Methyloprofundus sp.]|nr:hypothetical protein [Methyloprofundus sp.]